jgi:hypothetical protein
MNRVKEIRALLFKTVSDEFKNKDVNIEYNTECLFKVQPISTCEIDNIKITKSRDLLKSFGRVEPQSKALDALDMLFKEVKKNIESRRPSGVTLMNTEYDSVMSDDDSVISFSSEDYTDWTDWSGDNTDIDIKLIKCEEL